MVITFDDTLVSSKLTDLHRDEEEQLMQLLSDKYGLPYVDLRGLSPEPDALRVVNEADSQSAEIAAFKKVGQKLYVAVHSPNHPKLPEIVNQIRNSKFEPIFFIASFASLMHVWQRYGDLKLGEKQEKGQLELTQEKLEEIMNAFDNTDQQKVYFEMLLSQNILYKTTRMVEVIIAGALKFGASDIHIEPTENNIRLRYRIHGVLKDITSFDNSLRNQLTSRFKVISGLKISSTTTAQDGRFSIRYGDANIEMRVSLIPGNYGESFVMRILDPRKNAADFNKLSVNEKVRGILERALARPNGIILTTGPTGSGKSTTLYGFLKKVYSPEIKIITIEDPVEYHFQGITQTQVDEKKGYTFLNGLRSALRQDPDIIMVGEIRDEDTAKVAVNASLTGHLVLSTLHTNNAAGTIPRFIELGVLPKTLASSISLAIAQRLVRTLCPHCKKQTQTNRSEAEIIKNILAEMLHDNKEDQMDSFIPSDSYTIWKPVGCSECQEGWNGRTGIFEIMQMTPRIELLLTGQPSTNEIKEAMKDQATPTLREDAILKVLAGITSLEEAGKVIDLYES